MRCDELRARLDAAGPTGLSATHHAHARGCAACAAELQAAQAVETMLRAEPPTPSVAFTARVLDRVEATERARQRVAESPRSSAWGRWWRGIAEEPIAIVALALAPVPILLGVLWPGSAANLVELLRHAATLVAPIGAGLDLQSLSAAAPFVRMLLLLTAGLCSLGWLEAALIPSRRQARRKNRSQFS
jgi:hypothetical protein